MRFSIPIRLSLIAVVSLFRRWYIKNVQMMERGDDDVELNRLKDLMRKTEYLIIEKKISKPNSKLDQMGNVGIKYLVK